jgi:hypothetical protein
MASKPYLTETGELIIPSDTPAEYKWWDGGQSVKETLEELNASEEVVHRYVDQKKGLKS